MDFLMVIGGLMLIGIGAIARFKPQMLWDLYSIEPRWKRDHPDQPDDWDTRAHRHAPFYFAVGIIFILLSLIPLA